MDDMTYYGQKMANRWIYQFWYDIDIYPEHEKRRNYSGPEQTVLNI